MNTSLIFDSSNLRIKNSSFLSLASGGLLGSERVTGRKARGLQMEERGCKCQTFFTSLLSGRRKQTAAVFSPFSTQIQEEVPFKILCCLDDTWLHLNLTFLKPWANQCVFLMEMFFVSYVKETMYLPQNLGFFKSVPPKTHNRPDKPVCFSHTLLS